MAIVPKTKKKPIASYLLMRRASLTFAIMVTVSAFGTMGGAESINEEVVVTVDGTNLRFSPSTVTITEGDTVRFFWSGELLAHNAVSEEGLFDSGDPSREVDYLFTFELGTNGTHTYVCEPHEEVGMIGTINVEPAPAGDVPEPETGPETGNLNDSGESWIPFFGLEIVAAIMLFAVIYHFGRTQGLVETRLLIPDTDHQDGG